jgi:ketosteroid isomerase-like protein
VNTPETERAALREWLKTFQECVRTVDYERGRRLFAPDVMAFGTYSAIVVGIDELIRDQWSRIWPTITGFTYRVDEAYFGVDRDVAWIACAWDSEGRTPDGSAYSRPGRVTVGLKRDRGGHWVATHTHHSLYPRG